MVRASRSLFDEDAQYDTRFVGSSIHLLLCFACESFLLGVLVMALGLGSCSYLHSSLSKYQSNFLLDAAFRHFFLRLIANTDPSSSVWDQYR